VTAVATSAGWIARSQVYTAAERAVANARVVAAGRRLLARGATGAIESRAAEVLRGSVLAGWTGDGLRRVRGIVARSASADLAASARAAALDSRLYRWLTEEPEPEVIVIDLRETMSVGPAIAVLDRLAAAFARIAHTSGVVWASERAAERVRAAPVRVASVTLAVALVVVAFGSLLVGTLSGPLAVALVAGGLASLLGLRETRSLAELRDSQGGRALAALLAPPEPPGENNNEDEDGSDGRE